MRNWEKSKLLFDNKIASGEEFGESSDIRDIFWESGGK